MSSRAIFLVSLGALSCSDPASPGAADVIQLSTCPALSDGTPRPACTGNPTADGQTTVVIQACSQAPSVSTDERRTDLQATLHASRGSWVGHSTTDPTTVVVSLGSSPCALATLVTDQTPGVNDVQASLLGYTTDLEILQLPAAVSVVDIGTASQPPLQGTAASTVQFTVTAHTDTGGLPSVGTRVAFSVNGAQPSGQTVSLSPLASTLDATGAATVSAFVPAAVTTFTLTAAVTPAAHPELGGGTPTAKTANLTVIRQ